MAGIVDGYGVTRTFELAPGYGLFDAAPVWVDFTSYLRSVSWQRSGRTKELGDTQAGFMSAVVDNRSRVFDSAYGPATIAFDGSGGDYWACGDVAALSGATALDIRGGLSMPDWTPATDMAIVGQYGAAGQRAFRLYISTAGALIGVTSNDGTATADGTSGVQFCTSNGQAVAFRATWTAASGTWNFYIKRCPRERLRAEAQSNDDWVLVGTDATGGTAALFNSTTFVRVGLLGNGNDPLNGTVHFCQVATTINGAPTIVFDPADAATTSSTSWTGSVDARSWVGTGSWTGKIQSAYYEDLGPGTPARLKLSYLGTERELFYGYLRREGQQYPEFGIDNEVTLESIDGLGWLLDTEAPLTPYGIELKTLVFPPSAYWPLHEPASARQFADVIGDSHGSWSNAQSETGGPSQPGSVAPTRELTSGNWARASTMPTDTSIVDVGELTLWFWCHLEDTTSRFRVLVGTTDGSVGINYGYAAGTFFLTDGTNDYTLNGRLEPGSHFIQLTGPPAIPSLIVDGVLYLQSEQTGTATATTINFGLNVDGFDGATISDVSIGGASFDIDALVAAGATGRTLDTGGERATWLLRSAGVPSALRDISTDTATYMGPSSAGSTYGALLTQLALAEAGRWFVNRDGKFTYRSRLWNHTAAAATTTNGTFDDASGSNFYVDIEIAPRDWAEVVNECIVTIASGADGIFRSQSSHDALGGWHTMKLSAPLQSPEDAASLAEYIVRLRAFPRERITKLTLDPRVSPAALFPHVRDRNIGDRITVKRTAAAGTEQIAVDVQIEGIGGSMDRSGDFKVFWYTAPAAQSSSEAGFITIDDAVLGNYDAGLGFVP